MFKHDYSKSQKSNKLGVNRLGAFSVIKLTDKTAMMVYFPIHKRIHLVIRVSNVDQYVQQPEDIAPAVADRPAPVPTIKGGKHVVDQILSHQRRGRGIQFFTLTKGSSHYDAAW